MSKRLVSNILVTGGAGFIGSAFIRYICNLSNFNGTIVNLDLLTYAGNLDNIKACENDNRYHFYHGDINDSSLVISICDKHNIDTVVHFAAETHVDNSINDPKPFINANIFGTFSLLEVLRKRKNIHFHHISTDEVYGSLKKGYFTETSLYKPNSPYSATKASSDHLVRSYNKTYGLSTTLSHCTNNYGPYQHREKFIPTIIHACLERKPIPVYGDGKNCRDWLFVDDHADAIWKIIQFGENGETYDIGGERELSNIDLVRCCIEIIAREFCEDKDLLLKNLLSFVPDRLGHDFRYAIDCFKIKNELSWHPLHSIEEGLNKTIKWYLSSKKALKY